MSVERGSSNMSLVLLPGIVVDKDLPSTPFP